MSLPISILCLGPGDAALMRSVLSMFAGEAFHDVETHCAAQPGTGYLERLLGSDVFIAIAAVEGDRVVGGVAAYVLPKFERERSEIYIYDLAVAGTQETRYCHRHDRGASESWRVTRRPCNLRPGRLR
jgi:aminoglycoside 3-N-acetyltransferase I